jgi:hypothetical protein
LGFLVAEVLADDRDLGQDLSVVQHENFRPKADEYRPQIWMHRNIGWLK